MLGLLSLQVLGHNSFRLARTTLVKELVINFLRVCHSIRTLSAGGELEGASDANQAQQSRRYA